MSEYLSIDQDFVRRTKIIIEQYENLVNHNGEKYETTLLLNCLIGLLVLPKEILYNKIPNTELDRSTWGISSNEIIKIRQKKTVRNVVRHIRNSICHFRVTALSEYSIIKEIRFEDIDTNGDIVFIAEVSIENLKNFAHKISDFFLSNDW